MLRTHAPGVSLWEALLPEEVLRLPDELSQVDGLLDDPAFFAPFAPFFDPCLGRPSTPMEVYLRLMFLKFRYRLGHESLCREVSDSITWRRLCGIPLDGRVPHPTTLMKLTTRCGPTAVDACNQALLAKAAEAKLLRTSRLRADTTVVPADVSYPTDSGLLAKAIARIGVTGRRIQAAGGAVRTRLRDYSRAAGTRARAIAAKLRLRTAAGRDEAQAAVRRITGELTDLAERSARGRASTGQRSPSAAPDRCGGRRAGHRRDHRPGCRTPPRTAAPCSQRPYRSPHRDPPDRRPDPPAVVRCHPGRCDPAGQPARPGRPPDRQGSARAQIRRGFGLVLLSTATSWHSTSSSIAWTRLCDQAGPAS